MLATKNPYIQSADEQLQLISQDKEKRMEYEAREKAIRDYNQLMYEAQERGIAIGEERGIAIGEERGKEIGKHEEAVNIAKNLLALGLSADVISKVTNLSESEWK